MAVMKGVISPEDFYGRQSGAQVRMEAYMKKVTKSECFTQLPDFMVQLLGPSRTWKVFKKQDKAIDFMNGRRNGLMCFAYEQKGGQRLFLVAHPKVFWAVNYHRFSRNCSTYEIIQENVVCKLYLDIEFEYEYNPKLHDGDRMLKNFLTIVSANLDHYYGIKCTNDDVINLDSSNETKYSHHIIYQLHNTAFHNNYSAGNFIKRICSEIKTAFENEMRTKKDEISILARKYNLERENILEFFVNDSKGKLKLFIDEGVYTRNRHFRLLGSTKLGKKSPLIISSNNTYKPHADDTDLCMFLDSLITYFSSEISRVLECNDVKTKNTMQSNLNPKVCERNQGSTNFYPEIDTFVLRIIGSNGGIRRKSFFSSSSKIIYEIYGYRYCENIKRHHKSNNIMLIVDVHDLTYYQKCYDPDCSGFKSEVRKLPEEICFQIEDESDFFSFDTNADEVNNCLQDDFEFFDRTEKDVHEVIGCLEDLVKSNTAL